MFGVMLGAVSVAFGAAGIDVSSEVEHGGRMPPPHSVESLSTDETARHNFPLQASDTGLTVNFGGTFLQALGPDEAVCDGTPGAGIVC